MELTKYQKIRERVEVTGRCVSCTRKSLPGNVRCRVHAEINRLRSLAWRTKHPEARDQLKQAYRDRGLCELCPEHDPVETGKLHCTACLARFRGYYEARKEEGMCGRLGCPNKARDGLVLCREHRKENNAKQRYNTFEAVNLPNGITIGAK